VTKEDVTLRTQRRLATCTGDDEGHRSFGHLTAHS